MKMQQAAAGHVHVLDNQTLVVGDVRFLATTAWSDFTSTGDYRVAMSLCWGWMSDFTQIRIGEGFRKLRPVDLIARNICARDFLATELAKDFGGKTVVVTHHYPIEKVAQADAWIFGHTHNAVDTVVSGCRLTRIIQAMGQQYPVPITAYLSDVEISNDCAVGVVVGQIVPGFIEKRTGAYLLTTTPIFSLIRAGRFWVVVTKAGNFVLTSFKRGAGRKSLRALIATADSPDASSEREPGAFAGA